MSVETEVIDATVIVPAYNVESYIDKCIRSILDGVKHRIEIIVIDDGSSDRTTKVANQIAKKDPRVRVISKDNRGVSSARNSGIEASHGKYLFFVDADDRVPFQSIDKSISQFETDRCEALLLRAEFWYPSGKKRIQHIDTKIIKQIMDGVNPVYAGYPTYSWNYAFAREVIGHERFDETLSVSEDADFISRVCSGITKYGINPEVSYCYSVGRSGSALSRIDLEGCIDIKKVKASVIMRAKLLDDTSRLIDEYGAASFGVLRRCALNFGEYKSESQIPNDLLSLMKKSKKIKTIICVATHYHYVLMWPLFLLFSLFGKKLRVR